MPSVSMLLSSVVAVAAVGPAPPLLSAPLFPAASSSSSVVVGATPTLGWNSWNHYRGLLSEAVVKETADALVSTGLAAKGYVVRCPPSPPPPLPSPAAVLLTPSLRQSLLL